ncbi:MAG TPA: glycosyltransferase family 1 protein [Pyrinomonadaceae bacterium]|jgi:glycosyltransferase involved in cell wall biosynthesis|nr:glycosyltransferase family 1 protein [Pyrinomonadaceae bacterium]
MDNSVSYSLICLSHLRWDFVYQRPQHLLSRFAQKANVYFFEEPIYGDEPTRLDVSRREDNLFVIVPHISHSDRDSRSAVEIQREMLDKFIETENIDDFVLWFYTPMAMDFAAHLQPLATVFDCMDELSAFKFAPPELLENERQLLEKADLVFTGGQSLYEAKKDKHARVFAFPSSIDVAHFDQAREIEEEPADEKQLPHPRLGFCGVIDERMDIELLREMAELRPDWHFVMIGPVVKIAEEDLPRRENIHYLGGKDYKDLPAYLAGWDVALMPFAMNESTKYISPTKTPEYLAAGLPVVSTPIRDVVRPYGEQGLVQIASNAEEFVAACEQALEEVLSDRLQKADEFLSHSSWDKTFEEMSRLIDEAIDEKPKTATQAV